MEARRSRAVAIRPSGGGARPPYIDYPVTTFGLPTPRDFWANEGGAAHVPDGAGRRRHVTASLSGTRTVEAPSKSMKQGRIPTGRFRFTSSAARRRPGSRRTNAAGETPVPPERNRAAGRFVFVRQSPITISAAPRPDTGATWRARAAASPRPGPEAPGSSR